MPGQWPRRLSDSAYSAGAGGHRGGRASAGGLSGHDEPMVLPGARWAGPFSLSHFQIGEWYAHRQGRYRVLDREGPYLRVRLENGQLRHLHEATAWLIWEC